MTQRNGSLKFTCTKIDTGSGKGALKPDADGYYKVTIGAFDAYNSIKEYYPMEPAKKIFKKGSRLMRKLMAGDLKGEYGHPKQQPGQTKEQFAARLAQVYEENVSHHFKSIEVTPRKDAKGKVFFIVEAEIKPMGPQGQVLKDSLENPHENIGFSIRAPVNDKWVGITKHRSITDVITWDAVNTPGMAPANKFDSIQLQSGDAIAMESINEIVIPESLLYSGTGTSDLGHALENEGLDLRSLITEGGPPAKKHMSSTW